ncbi:MAG: hypothetical protein AAFR54_15660, partial [Planctomycetota bacterium]
GSGAMDKHHLPLAAATAAALFGASQASAQDRFLFSIDWQSPTVGTPDPSGVAITEGDILVPSTPTSLPSLTLPAGPSIAIPHVGGLGLPPGCAGHPGGTPCFVEVDAFSMGGDATFVPFNEVRPGQIAFSVDEYAFAGFPNPFPSVTTEAPVGDSSADCYLNADFLPPAPVPFGPGRHVGWVDGNAAPSGSGALYPGTGLIEPNFPMPGPVDNGDNLDALDVAQNSITAMPGLYYSLDASFVDPLEGVPHSASALALGYVGGDVLTPGAAGFPVVYAPAGLLGLDLFGPDTDDLDALSLRENGVFGYQVSNAPYDWVTGGSDQLVFSVRRGSAVIGMPDSILGIPIEEGDLLVPPVAGGASPFPGILVTAELIGLSTMRAGFGNFGDDLNALDLLRPPVLDCDGDGIEDAIAILTGLVPDADGNGVPDSCTTIFPTPGPIGVAGCFCPATVAPCGNASPTTGCIHSLGTGGILSGFGTQVGGAAITGVDDLVLTASSLPGPSFSLFFYGPPIGGVVTLGNGRLCVGAPLYRLLPVIPVSGAGVATYGPGIVATSAFTGPGGLITAGSTWVFQTWFRELGPGPCGLGSNLTNGLSVTFI